MIKKTGWVLASICFFVVVTPVVCNAVTSNGDLLVKVYDDLKAGRNQEAKNTLLDIQESFTEIGKRGETVPVVEQETFDYFSAMAEFLVGSIGPSTDLAQNYIVRYGEKGIFTADMEYVKKENAAISFKKINAQLRTIANYWDEIQVNRDRDGSMSSLKKILGKMKKNMLAAADIVRDLYPKCMDPAFYDFEISADYIENARQSTDRDSINAALSNAVHFSNRAGETLGACISTLSK